MVEKFWGINGWIALRDYYSAGVTLDFKVGQDLENRKELSSWLLTRWA